MAEGRGWTLIKSSTNNTGKGKEPGEENRTIERLSFLKVLGAAGAGAAMLPASAILTTGTVHGEERSGRLDKGDAAILRFLAAAEIIETDLWQQYNELGGIPDNEVPGGGGSALYT